MSAGLKARKVLGEQGFHSRGEDSASRNISFIISVIAKKIPVDEKLSLTGFRAENHPFVRPSFPVDPIHAREMGSNSADFGKKSYSRTIQGLDRSSCARLGAGGPGVIRAQ